MPAQDPDRDGRGPGSEDDAPREVAGQEEQTRPVRLSANLAAAQAALADEESRRPTGEVPSVGHEVRANAPDQRVHTSPIGNILPSEVLQTLDDAASDAAGLPRNPPDSGRISGRRRASAISGGSGPLGGTFPQGPGRSGPHRADRTPRTATDPIRALGERAGERRGGRRSSPKLRRPGRSQFPALSPPPRRPRLADDERFAEADRSAPRHAAPDAPVAIGFEPTHYIPRRRRSALLLQSLRTLMWGLLWLGLGGAVAFSVVVLYRRSQPARPLAVVPPPAPPRRATPGPAKVPASPPRATPPSSAAPLLSSTQARDLVVPIPASGDRPAAGLPLPAATPMNPASALPAVTPTTPAAASLVPPLPPLDPQQQAAADQTMSNIEFVVSERVAQVRACYDRAVRSEGPDAPAGRVEVALTLSDEGQPTSIVTVGNTVGIPQLAGCLEQRIAEWHFPRPLGIARTFHLPFTFSPSPQQSGPRPRR